MHADSVGACTANHMNQSQTQMRIYLLSVQVEPHLLRNEAVNLHTALFHVQHLLQGQTACVLGSFQTTNQALVLHPLDDLLGLFLGEAHLVTHAAEILSVFFGH